MIYMGYHVKLSDMPQAPAAAAVGERVVVEVPEEEHGDAAPPNKADIEAFEWISRRFEASPAVSGLGTWPAGGRWARRSSTRRWRAS